MSDIPIPEIAPVLPDVPVSALGYSFPLFGFNFTTSRILILLGIIILAILFFVIYRKYIKKEEEPKKETEVDQDSHNDVLMKQYPHKSLPNLQALQQQLDQQQQALQQQIAHNQMLQQQIAQQQQIMAKMDQALQQHQSKPVVQEVNLEDQIPVFEN